MSDLATLERCLGAMGTAFRLVRLYPSTHPAVQEALRTLAAQLEGVAALGTVEWKVGATGMHWRGQHLLPRNSQLSELASLLFARGVRGVQLNPGVTPEHALALYGVATGTTQPDDVTLGRVTVQTSRRTMTSLSLALGSACPDDGAAPLEEDAGDGRSTFECHVPTGRVAAGRGMPAARRRPADRREPGGAAQRRGPVARNDPRSA
jgi:hypothetical protein